MDTLLGSEQVSDMDIAFTVDGNLSTALDLTQQSY
jgi:hypothetical protein